jgi:hypothetical protein
MANSLKVTRLDSPLQGLRGDDDGADQRSSSADAPTRAESDERSSPGVVARPSVEATPRRSPPQGHRTPEPPAPEPVTASIGDSSATPENHLWAPPAWDERVELISTRLPVSLSRALERHTRALRDRHDLSSQKALPMQEVLAAVVWALGDPDDEAASDRLDAVYRSYRSHRMAAEARALEQS